ncbi:MAG: 30S ribosomal protein S16 [Patescibacteria group bacterium]|nr:30S ribosomal protein S16 [Patescibacteria group bacterium]
MIRLQRKGKKHQPFYRLVVGEKRSKLKGEQFEQLGWFDPGTNQSSFEKERIQYWLKIGAKMSPTVNNLLISQGITTGKKIAVHNVKKAEAAPAAAAAPKA